MNGEDVKATRQKLGLSQAQFAEQYKINVYTLRQWERKNHELSSVASAYMTCIQANSYIILTSLENNS